MNMTRLLRAHRTLRLAKPSRRLRRPPVSWVSSASLHRPLRRTCSSRTSRRSVRASRTPSPDGSTSTPKSSSGPGARRATDEVSAEQAATGNAAIAQADAAYDRGISLYILNDYAAAIEAFDEALRLYDANPGDIQRFDPVMDTTFKLAECHFKAGNEERARTVLSRTALRPSKRPTSRPGRRTTSSMVRSRATSPAPGVGRLRWTPRRPGSRCRSTASTWGRPLSRGPCPRAPTT